MKLSFGKQKYHKPKILTKKADYCLRKLEKTWILQYLTNLGIDPQLGVRIVVDKLLNLAIDRLYETSGKSIWPSICIRMIDTDGSFLISPLHISIKNLKKYFYFSVFRLSDGRLNGQWRPNLQFELWPSDSRCEIFQSNWIFKIFILLDFSNEIFWKAKINR